MNYFPVPPSVCFTFDTFSHVWTIAVPNQVKRHIFNIYSGVPGIPQPPPYTLLRQLISTLFTPAYTISKQSIATHGTLCCTQCPSSSVVCTNKRPGKRCFPRFAWRTVPLEPAEPIHCNTERFCDGVPKQTVREGGPKTHSFPGPKKTRTK